MQIDYLNELPANITKTYIAYSACPDSEPTRKMELMLDVFKQTVHYFGCVFLSEYLWDMDTNHETVNTIIRKLTRPSLGTWYDLIKSYIKFFGKETWLEGVYDCYLKNDKEKIPIRCYS